MSATAFQRMRREAEAKAKASQEPIQIEDDSNLNNMTAEELIEYAKEHSIDIGNASSQKGILKKIKESERLHGAK